MSAMTQPHVVFMNIAATGHMNPTLPLVSRLVSRGCKVTYFVDGSMRAVVEAAGAAWKPFRYANHDFTGILRQPGHFAALTAAERAAVGLTDDAPEHLTRFPFSVMYNSQLVLPQLLDDVRALSPRVSAIVCDPFLPCGRVAAHVHGAAPVSMLTMPGPGVFTLPDEVEDLPWVEGPRQWIRSEYGIDVFEDASLLEFYSPVLNLVTTLEDFYAPPKSEKQVRRFGHAPFRCVGALLDPGVRRIENADIAEGLGAGLGSPSPALLAALSAKEDDYRLVLVSLGTVATGKFWREAFGSVAADNDEWVEGTRSLMDYTGKEFCLFVFRAVFEAVARDPGMFAIVSMGPNMADALEALPEPPSNMVVCKSVPQVDLLPLCDAFVTHGGANSVHEALSFGVPLCVVPIFGDQPTNADTIARIGAGVSFRSPLRTLSADSLRGALGDIGGGIFRSTFKAAAQEASAKLAAADGIENSVDALLEAGSAQGVARQAEAAVSTKEASVAPARRQAKLGGA
ncbi:unnamed protein product [Prorocentrum cordatum]|uniref:Uncharacterized protein n=1 Tax=Prorocentrum cordatum TaxID=2364126 RepID=A0ABN9RBS8_9DINO|nr:unnamed protein product [Polarella glacialis]